MAGYTAALGLGVNTVTSQAGAGETVTLSLAQGAVAALCCVLTRKRRE